MLASLVIEFVVDGAAHVLRGIGDTGASLHITEITVEIEISPLSTYDFHSLKTRTGEKTSTVISLCASHKRHSGDNLGIFVVSQKICQRFPEALSTDSKSSQRLQCPYPSQLI